MTLSDYLSDRYTPGTASRYLREIEKLRAVLPHAEQATYNDLVGYLGELRPHYQHLGPVLHALKAYYQYLIDTGQRDDHPAQAIRLRDQPGRDIALERLFSPQELDTLLQRTERYPLLKHRNLLALSLLIYQALTNGDLTRLRLDDLQLESGTIHIRPTHRSNARTLSLKPQQIHWLHQYLDHDRPKLLRAPTDCLLISSRCTPETAEGISYLVETCKPRFPHRTLNAKTIRQSVIANLLQAGHDLRVVQAFAGHKYPSTTERYRQSPLAALQQAVQQHHPLDQL